MNYDAAGPFVFIKYLVDHLPDKEIAVDGAMKVFHLEDREEARHCVNMFCNMEKLFVVVPELAQNMIQAGKDVIQDDAIVERIQQKALEIQQEEAQKDMESEQRSFDSWESYQQWRRINRFNDNNNQ